MCHLRVLNDVTQLLRHQMIQLRKAHSAEGREKPDLYEWLDNLVCDYDTALITHPVKNGLSFCRTQWGDSDLKTKPQTGDCLYEHHFTIFIVFTGIT